jgi:hypothetical protein
VRKKRLPPLPLSVQVPLIIVGAGGSYAGLMFGIFNQVNDHTDMRVAVAADIAIIVGIAAVAWLGYEGGRRKAPTVQPLRE